MSYLLNSRAKIKIYSINNDYDALQLIKKYFLIINFSFLLIIQDNLSYGLFSYGLGG